MSVSVVFPLYFPFGRGLPLGLSSAVPSSVSLPFNGNGKKTAAPKSKTEPGTANPRPPQKQENVDNTVCLAVVVVSGGGFRSGKKWKHARTHTQLFQLFVRSRWMQDFQFPVPCWTCCVPDFRVRGSISGSVSEAPNTRKPKPKCPWDGNPEQA